MDALICNQNKLCGVMMGGGGSDMASLGEDTVIIVETHTMKVGHEYGVMGLRLGSSFTSRLLYY